ncbi:MAG: oxidoreductase [Candidatus Hodarchaeales archaeon]|jgi:NAD(P)-dependent dehydrogenase (short-subunit alcohol dehydrogenase family)
MTKNNKWTIDNIPDLHGKIVIVSGANSGTGFEVSKEMSKKGAHIVMACRSESRGQVALEKIQKEYPSVSLELMILDLSSLSSIKQFSEDYNAKYDRLDILCNNAGVMQTPYIITEDGFELQIGTNHLGHFALTGLLLDLLKITKNSRVITMSSMAHMMGKIDLDNLHWETPKKYDRTGAYAQSKLANLMFAYELDRKLKEANISVLSIGAHPGYSATKLQSAGLGLEKGFRAKIWRWSYKFSNKIIAQSVQMGSLPMLMAATDNDIKGGDYIGPEKFRGMRGYPHKAKSNGLSHNIDIAKELWNLSEKLTGVGYNFA